jgi:hypothetical protein
MAAPYDQQELSTKLPANRHLAELIAIDPSDIRRTLDRAVAGAATT